MLPINCRLNLKKYEVFSILTDKPTINLFEISQSFCLIILEVFLESKKLKSMAMFLNSHNLSCQYDIAF